MSKNKSSEQTRKQSIKNLNSNVNAHAQAIARAHSKRLQQQHMEMQRYFKNQAYQQRLQRMEARIVYGPCIQILNNPNMLSLPGLPNTRLPQTQAQLEALIQDEQRRRQQRKQYQQFESFAPKSHKLMKYDKK